MNTMKLKVIIATNGHSHSHNYDHIHDHAHDNKDIIVFTSRDGSK